MNDKVRPQEQKDIQPAVAEGAIARSLGRRRFLGAGSAAAPFVLTLVSQPALGVTCFTPSRSLSRNTSLSQTDKNGDCTGAESPGNYKAQQSPTKPNGHTNPAYHWPPYPTPDTPFHDIFYKNPGGVRLVTKFEKDNGTNMTMGEVLDLYEPGSGNLVFHIIAAYLNKKGGAGAKIPDIVLTELDIKDIWREYALNGYYTPMGGVQWTGQQIVDYLVSNGIVK